jgi:RimJ/RimL family protein N-acetyltransferase
MFKNRIFLRKVVIKDAPLLAKWFNDKKNVYYLNPIIRCRKHTTKSIADELKNSDFEYERLFMICLKSNRKPIGHAGIDDLDFYDKRGEIFFLIGEKEEQGKGYGLESLRLLLNYAFNKLKLHSLLATVTPNNKPSLKMLKKTGFKKVGIRREYNNYNDKYNDEILLDLLDREFFLRKNK